MDPAAKPGRIEAIYNEFKKTCFEFVKPEPAKDDDLLLVHTKNLINSVKRKGIYEIAGLSAGGAIKAAEIGLQDAAFALIRPPGHHAGKNFNGGFCYFNNMAVAVEKLIKGGKIGKALIVDIDLHYGNGTADIFQGRKDVSILDINSNTKEEYIKRLKDQLDTIKGYDIIGISAGFDRYELDWGGMFKTEDYNTIGKIIKNKAYKNCNGKYFAVLEGGYYIPDLGKNVRSLIDGMT
ncbi:MAG: histone deacetylase family protein [Thermodesulfobacteriota bacterium]|nr:histone deacetylase family protein [Thermodesulfobacteriota bacterium]